MLKKKTGNKIGTATIFGENIAQKILRKHLINGVLKCGEEIGLKIDQTLTQDATGTLVCLEFESLNIPKVKTKLSVSYVDHNTLQSGFENFDDHLFLQTFAAKYGIYFSKSGQGICHQVHLERFAIPGDTLLGSDSHTPTCGGLGMLAIGAGGLDVAWALAGRPFYFIRPKIIKVNLIGTLKPWVSAKDIILEILRRWGVKGGIGKIFEYTGNGLKNLSVPERATICNMGAELGATTSIFPSDEETLKFLRWQNRAKDWKEIKPDNNAHYDEEITIKLDKLEPLIARPHSPDNVCKVRELKKIKVNQVIVGSCTNSSYKDLMKVAYILKNKRIHPDVSFVVAPGSKQVLEMIAKNGALSTIIKAGGRILETACGPCLGMGQAPASCGVSLRTFNRNFKGRSGTADAEVYLCSPEVAAYSAIKGYISDPRELRKMPEIIEPKVDVNDSLIIKPPKDSLKIKIIRGPNIKPLPHFSKLKKNLTGGVLIKLKDNITTDDILPAGAKILPLRSNIPAISEYVFSKIDVNFVKRAKEKKGGFIVAGKNYGQGSSREHAAISPRYLGVKAAVAKSFARIHLANLTNFGILPLTFTNEKDYDKISEGDILEIRNQKENLEISNKTKNYRFKVKLYLQKRQKDIILAGGLLNYISNE
ncbi:MAG: aconitate hydratase [Candidatus Firestonebacteria bacterium]